MIRYGCSPRHGLGGADPSQNQDRSKDQAQNAPPGKDMNTHGDGPDTGTGSTDASGARGSPAHGGGNNDLHYADMPGVEDSTIMHGNPTPYAADMRDEASRHTRGGDLSIAGGSGGSGGGGSDVLDTTAGPSGPMTSTPSIEDTGSAGSPSNEHDVSATAPHAIDHAPHRAPAPGGVNEPGPEAQP